MAIDLGLGQPAEHMLRSALIATRLADRLGLTSAQRDCIYYTTLIMWIGCHADSHEYARWFGDDIAVRRSCLPGRLVRVAVSAVPADQHRSRRVVVAAAEDDRDAVCRMRVATSRG